MRGHKKTYFDSLGYTEADNIPCEVCGAPAVDIHHIEARGMGGTTNPFKNSIFNLMAVCRKCHNEYGDKVKYKEALKKKHIERLLTRMVHAMGVYKEVNFSEDKIEFKRN